MSALLQTAAEIAAEKTTPIAPSPVVPVNQNWSPTEAEIVIEQRRTGNLERNSVIASLQSQWMLRQARMAEVDPAATDRELQARAEAIAAAEHAARVAQESAEGVEIVSAGLIAYGRAVYKIKLLQKLALPSEDVERVAADAIEKFLAFGTDSIEHGWMTAMPALQEIAARRIISDFVPAKIAELEAEAAALRAEVLAESVARNIDHIKCLALLSRETQEFGNGGGHPRFSDFGRLSANNCFSGLYPKEDFSSAAENVPAAGNVATGNAS